MAHLIKVDQDLPTRFATALREGGHDAVSVVEQGMSGAQDRDLWKVIQSERRCLWTGDVAFASMGDHFTPDHHGVVLFRPGRESLPMYLVLLDLFMAHPAFDDTLTGALVVVAPGRVRVRHPRGRTHGRGESAADEGDST